MLSEEDAITFRTVKVCSALAISRNTLSQMVSDGILAGLQLDAAVTLAGVGRDFTLSDVFKLALFRALRGADLDTRRAVFFARQAVDQFDADPQTIRTLRYGNFYKEEVLDLTGDAEFTDPVLITVNLHMLFRQTVDRLKAVEKSGATWSTGE